MLQGLYANHVREMQQRWQGAMVASGWDAVLIHSGSPIVSFLDDYEYAFRPNPHLLAWVPLIHHAESALLVRPGERPLLWFYQPLDYWYLPPADPESWWADHVEVRVVTEPGAWVEETPLLPDRTAVIGDAPSLAGRFAAQQLNPEALLCRLHLERTRKTAYEIECMREANRRAARGHVAARRAFEDGNSEFDIHLAYLAACRQTDAELPYNSIVALNEAGSVLHYQQRLRVLSDDVRSFLIDAGATCNAYAADITRTYASRPGDFADLIAAMEMVQRDLAGAVAPGLDYRELHLAAHRRIAGVLKAAGVIRVPVDVAVESGLSSVFFPHGLGHFIGLQTHDVAGLIDNQGRPSPRPQEHPYLRLTRVLEPGNVLTIEPGLYFIEPLLAKWRQEGDRAAVDWDLVSQLAPFGGIRIEDDVAVTADGSENLTRPAFDVEEVPAYSGIRPNACSALRSKRPAGP